MSFKLLHTLKKLNSYNNPSTTEPNLFTRAQSGVSFQLLADVGAVYSLRCVCSVVCTERLATTKPEQVKCSMCQLSETHSSTRGGQAEIPEFIDPAETPLDINIRAVKFIIISSFCSVETCRCSSPY